MGRRAYRRPSDRQLAESRAIALTLQRGLLPQRLRQVSAVEVSRRYVPADTDAGIGGDWFDVIQLSGTRVAVVVGDVTGHGVHAAATMGRLRAAMHTLADSDFTPEEVLVRMDDLVIRLAEDAEGGETGASCLYLIYDPISRRCTVAGAGHPSPALMTPDGRFEFPALPENPPLGLGGIAFESIDLTLPEGTVIALFTHGLLDLRHRNPDDALSWLSNALTHVRHASGPFTLRLIYDHALICEVSDASNAAPPPAPRPAARRGRRGLLLVGHLADRWGTRHTEHGKTISAEQSLDGHSPEQALELVRGGSRSGPPLIVPVSGGRA